MTMASAYLHGTDILGAPDPSEWKSVHDFGDLQRVDQIGIVPLATSPAAYVGQVVGNGQCVKFAQAACGLPGTSDWREGDRVKGNLSLSPGTPIATFQDGRYGNHVDGRSHAAVYVSQDDEGIKVYDQWKGQPVHTRVIRFRNGSTVPINDGDTYSVVVI